jgi:tetratricopeptide (TPR) repeat protein
VSAPPPSRKPSPLDRSAASNGEFVDLGEWLRSGENPKSTRMVAEEKPPTGDEQADFQEMLKRFKQGVAENVDDEDYESHYDLGVAYKEMGLIDEAVAEFQKALRGTTQRVRAYEALGQCFVEKEQYQVAASVLGRAIALGEGDDHHLVGVLYLLGRAVEALGRNRDALDYYQRVFAVDIEFRDVAERIIEIERKAT